MLRVLAGVLVVWVVFLPLDDIGTAQGPVECAIDANMAESIDESVGMVSRVLVDINAELGTVVTEDAAVLYHRTLASMRQYHEDLRADLPPCALPMNARLIDAIAATQDVLALVLARDVLETRVFASEFRRITAFMNARFSTLNDERQAVTLVDAE